MNDTITEPRVYIQADVFGAGFVRSPGNDFKGTSKSKILAKTYTTFTVNHSYLNQTYNFDTPPPCQYNIDSLWLVHHYSVNTESPSNSFPTIRQLERHKIKDGSDYKTLLIWAKEKRICFGEANPTDKVKYDLLQLLGDY